MEFLFSINVYVFIPMVLFLELKISKNCQKWVYMVVFYSSKRKKLIQRTHYS